MSHGLQAAIRDWRQRPGRCPRLFVPRTRAGGLDYRRTCLCGSDAGHAPPHVCPDCGGTWGRRA